MFLLPVSGLNGLQVLLGYWKPPKEKKCTQILC